jgi:hypothetical protein
VVPPDADTIRVTPRERITDELREQLKEHKGEIMRHMLWRQAVVWLTERWPGNPADADVSPLAAKREEVNEAWYEDFATYRAAVRAYVTAALKEIERLKAEHA